MKTGWINEKRAEPIVEYNGVALITKGGVAIEVPEEKKHLWEGMPLIELPDDFETVVY